MPFRTGEVMLLINIPAKVVTGVTFGGENLDMLLVATTTIALDISTGQPTNETFPEDSGKVFSVTGLGATGVLAYTVEV